MPIPHSPFERAADAAPDRPRRDRVERELQAAKEAAEAAEVRSAFLAEVGAILAASLDYEVTLASLVRLAVPRIADYCTLFEVAEEGLRQVASAHVDPAREPLLRRLGELYFAASGQPRRPSTLIARVVETGRPLLIRKESYERGEDLAGHPERLDIYRRLDRRSSMILPLSARGQTLGVLFLATAESERRYDEADLALGEELARRAALAVDNARLYREAQAASEAKDRFLATLSHELRTPLTPVLALVASLQEDPRLAGTFQRELAIIRRNVELEARLIDDLLDLTRIRRDKLELRREVVDLRQVVEHALEACATELSGAGLRLAVELGPGDQRLWADPPRLIQVFWNLLRNAIKFTPAGGTLAVRSRLETGDAGDAEGWLAVTVADTGMGIDPEVLPLIFDAFEQGRSGIARRLGGLGLGLAISKAIVELHGGTLTAASAGRQQGAAFTVRLPVTAWLPGEASPSPAGGEEGAAAAIAAIAAIAAGLPEPGPSHILLVEDHVDTAEAMADLLRAFGYHVSVAGSVAGGLALAEEWQAREEREPDAGIDLLVSDIGLPDGSGLDLIRALGERWGIRGIALSGYGTEEDVQRSREAGFLRHLTKPVTPRALEAAVREALNRKI